MEKGVQAVLFHAWKSNSVQALGKTLSAGKYRGTVHLGVAPFTALPGGLGGLAANMSTLRQSYKGPLSVCIFLSFHNESPTAAEVTSRATKVQAQLAAVTGSASKVSICPMLEDNWKGDRIKVSAMLAAAAAPFVVNGRLQQVSLRRSSNDNSQVPTSLTIPAVGRGNPTVIRPAIEFESHGMTPLPGSKFYSNDGNFVCLDVAPAGLPQALPYLEGKDSASNPPGIANDDRHKFNVAEYLRVNAAVSLLWRPMYNLYPVASFGPDKVNGRPKAHYNMKPASRADTETGTFNEVEAACLARFLQ